MTTLETRRLRGDLIEVFKIFKGFEDISWETFFVKSTTSQLRGHQLKLFKKRSTLDIRKHFFSQRIDEWNKLPAELINSESVMKIKKKIDSHLRLNRGLR